MSISIQGISGASSADASGSISKQKADLQKLVTQYGRLASQGSPGAALAGLEKSITTGAKSLGVNVTLPKLGADLKAVANQVGVTPPGGIDSARELEVAYSRRASQGVSDRDVAGLERTVKQDAATRGVSLDAPEVRYAAATVDGQVRAGATDAAEATRLNIVG